MFGGALCSAAAIGAPWEARAAPAGDLRVIVVDPRASERLVVGTWSEGVFRSDDGDEAGPRPARTGPAHDLRKQNKNKRRR